jgi:formylglycine-generating enzyme required for sulfatase activity
VAYRFNIGKYDVTVGQYAGFLNAVAATDNYGLYNPSMATDLNIAGIARNGQSGSYNYSVIGSPDHPITYVSWGDAARFANWLNNGQPVGVEGPGTTETGAYTLNGAVSDAALNAVTRSASAKWFIPSESEWYKAAYYDPAAGHYWTYATGTNTTPTSAPPGSDPNTANFYSFSTGFVVTSTSYSDFSNRQDYLTDVGAYTASASPYGTFDQTGNVFQWNEALIDGVGRGVRGGAWYYDASYLPSSGRYNYYPSGKNFSYFGFRVATIPEPSTGMLAIVAGCAVWWRRKRFSV